MRRARFTRGICAAVVAGALLLAPATAFGLSMSWEPIGDYASVLNQPHFAWPYVAWADQFTGTHLLDLRDGTRVELTSNSQEPFLSEDMVGWWNGTAWSVRMFGSEETTQLPAAITSDPVLASGTRIVQFDPSPRVYDCLTGSLVATLGLSTVARSAIDGDRLAWSTPQGNGRALKVWDFVADTSSIVATSPQLITAVGIEGDRVVYASNKDGQGSAVYLVNISTGVETMLCRARNWPLQVQLCGDYVYFDGYGVSVFNLRTGELSQAAIALSGYVEWSSWRDHTVVNQDGFLRLGTADIAPPITTSDAEPAYLAQASVHLAALDDVSPAEGCRTFWSLDGGAAVESSMTGVLESGDHTLEFWSRDEMGNEELPHRSVSFTVEPGYRIAATAGPDGSITDPGVTAHHGGDDCTYTITPATGYHILDVVVDGVSVGPVGAYSFAAVSSDHTIAATFAADALPKAIVGTPVAPSTMYRNRAATIYGYVSPSHSSGTYLVTLRFYKKNSAGKYVYHHSVKAKRYYHSSSRSKYKAYTSLPHRGRWRVKAFHSCVSHAEGSSGYDYITVR